jgi:hypothetical protein
MIGWMALAAAIGAQTGQAEHHSTSTTEAAVPSAPAAHVSGNVVTHPVEKIRVRVPEKAAYAGSERFNLYGVADAEIHVFVEADAAKKSLPSKEDWPYLPKLERPWYGQYH